MPAHPDQVTTDMVLALHASPAQGSFVVTGAGSRFLGWLFGEGGSSGTVLDAQIPYAQHALNDYVGHSLEQNVSEISAIAMAEEAYWKALRLDAFAHPDSIGERQIIGVSCTATIATNRLKRGEHRAHIAVRTAVVREWFRPDPIRLQLALRAGIAGGGVLIAMLVMLPALTITADIVALLGAGLYITTELGMTMSAYVAQTLDTLEIEDVTHGLTKSVIFAVVITVIGVVEGSTVKGGAGLHGDVGQLERLGKSRIAA